MPTTTPPLRGRPRDAALEDKVYDAVLSVYRRTGWSGFSLEAVAQAAGVGREALYRRWSGKAEMLAAAVHARSPVLEPIDTGSSHEDLAALARHFVASYRDPIGVVGLRMVLDSRTVPELAERFNAMTAGARLARTRAVVRRAVARGDLPVATSVTAVVATLTGATLSHVLYSARERQSAAADERHVQQLVALLLAPAGPR
jgi:AcrR family transcriptional regulator